MPYDEKAKKSFAMSIASGLPKGMGKSKPDPMGDEGAGDDEEARATAGSDLADALKGGDGAAIADAFAALRDLA